MFETITNGFLIAKINTKGAELTSLKSKNREYIWEGNPEFWGKHSPVLFPIVGTLKNNKYVYKNNEYSMLRHGFARDMDFIVIKKTEDLIVFSLKFNKETLEKYPFSFDLQIKYYFDNKILKIKYTIINLGTDKMPFSIGAHPAFAMPQNFEDYFLKFDKQEVLESFELENDLISNKTNTIYLTETKLPLKYALFKKDALIFKKLQSKKITIVEKEVPIISIHFADFPNLGIWTKIDAPFICIEPWLGYSDTSSNSGNLLEKEAIQVLDSMSSKDLEFCIEII